MQENIYSRLAQFIQHKNLSVRAFEQQAGLSNATVSRSIKNNTSFAVEHLEKIVLAFPDLDLNWLVKGEGEPLPNSIATNNTSTTIFTSQIQERFALFVEESGYTKQYIERKLGLSNGYVGKIVAGKSSFSVDILENILHTFTEINPMWLITGSGEMFLSSKQKNELNIEIDALIEKRLDEILQKRGIVL